MGAFHSLSLFLCYAGCCALRLSAHRLRGSPQRRRCQPLNELAAKDVRLVYQSREGRLCPIKRFVPSHLFQLHRRVQRAFRAECTRGPGNSIGGTFEVLRASNGDRVPHVGQPSWPFLLKGLDGPNQGLAILAETLQHSLAIHCRIGIPDRHRCPVTRGGVEQFRTFLWQLLSGVTWQSLEPGRTPAGLRSGGHEIA